jgi:hypothetical protein
MSMLGIFVYGSDGADARSFVILQPSVRRVKRALGLVPTGVDARSGTPVFARSYRSLTRSFGR